MSSTAVIVSIVSILGCLMLAMRSANIRSMPARRGVQLAVIWAAIIIGLVALISLFGVQVPS